MSNSCTSYISIDKLYDDSYFSMSDLEYLILSGDIKGAEEYLVSWGKGNDKNIIRHFEAYVKRWYVNQYRIDK